MCISPSQQACTVWLSTTYICRDHTKAAYAPSYSITDPCHKNSDMPRRITSWILPFFRNAEKLRSTDYPSKLLASIAIIPAPTPHSLVPYSHVLPHVHLLPGSIAPRSSWLPRWPATDLNSSAATHLIGVAHHAAFQYLIWAQNAPRWELAGKRSDRAFKDWRV